jgi:hypothetical protein
MATYIYLASLSTASRAIVALHHAKSAVFYDHRQAMLLKCGLKEYIGRRGFRPLANHARGVKHADHESSMSSLAK